jgi:tetratricopeptide (TPR) repeat protein
MPRIFALLLLACLALPACGQPEFPQVTTRAAALHALESTDARYRAAGVLYVSVNGLAADGPLLVKRLSDENAFVRELAEEGVWHVWSRSGDAETDRLLTSGVEEMGAGHYPQAIRIFSRVIERTPAFAEGWNKRATAYFLAGELRKSLADCDEVIKRNPQHFGALSGYGQIYLHLEQYEKAIEYFRRALDVNPNLPDVENTIRRIENLEEKKGWHKI